MALIKNLSENTRQRIATMVSFFILPMSGFATDIFIPSMPSMASDLQISSPQVQITLSLFLITFGIAQLFVGAILDSYGRYKLSQVAFLLFTLASIVIALSENIYLIYAMRVVHGVTVAVIVVAKRAYFVDLYKGEVLKNYLSIFTVVWSVGPIVAPFVGGYLQTLFGWQSNFYFLAIYAAILGILELLFNRETIVNPVRFDFKKIGHTYLEMLTTGRFMLGVIMLGLSYSMVMIYNLTGPFVIEHKLHLSPVIIGYTSLFLGLAWTCGGLASKATMQKPLIGKIFINLALQLTFGIIMFLSFGHLGSLFIILFFAFVIHTSAGYTFTNFFTYNMAQFPNNAGISGGLIGGITYMIVSPLTYALATFVPAKDERNLSISYLLLITGCALVLFGVYLMSKRKVQE